MDISKIRSERISNNATVKVLLDYFPKKYTEVPLEYNKKSDLDLEMHAGALCLYATTLLTRVYETDTAKIKCECSERKQAIRKMFLKSPKYQKYTNEQLEAKVNETILSNIRNSIAHGNFEISYDVYTKKLNFILWSTLKGLEENKPIIINKKDLFEINRKYIANQSINAEFFVNNNNIYNKDVKNKGINDFCLMTQTIKLAENYIGKTTKYDERVKIRENDFSLISYILFACQMIYEQNEYYNIFNQESNIFGKTAHIRNSLIHDWFNIDFNSFSVTHTDIDISSTEPITKNLAMLHLAKDLKNLELFIKQRYGEKDQDSIDKANAFFDYLFIENGFTNDTPPQFKNGDSEEHDEPQSE